MQDANESPIIPLFRINAVKTDNNQVAFEMDHEPAANALITRSMSDDMGKALEQQFKDLVGIAFENYRKFYTTTQGGNLETPAQ